MIDHAAACADATRWGSRMRGLVLGLALGDSLGGARGRFPASGPLPAGVTSQLAAFTIDGSIRALLRGLHKGICHQPSVVWHAYCRWAAVQGIESEAMRRRWDSGTRQPWPDGWLAQVPVIGERRGNAPATVVALRKLVQGTVETPITNSRGCHALTRALPLASVSYIGGDLTGYARDVAALTHGDPQAHAATSVGVHLAARCLTAGSFDRAVNASLTVRGADLDTGLMLDVDQAQRTGLKHPRPLKWLRKVAPDATAPSALLGGVYVALSFPQASEAMEALQFAASAPDADSVAAVTGAFLGALHGVEVWPVGLVSRLELAWVMDTLARDLVLQVVDNPGGSEHDEPRDPHWWDRYPGW
jgi:ADP-ribosylglycohydrolase